MNKTIENLAKIFKGNPFTEKLLFVPSYFIGHQIGKWFAKKAPEIDTIHSRSTQLY